MALLHTGDNGAEIVISENRAGSTFGHLGTLDTHGHADACLVERQHIVDAIAKENCQQTARAKLAEDGLSAGRKGAPQSMSQTNQTLLCLFG